MNKLAGIIVFYLVLLPGIFLSCKKEEIKELPRLSIDSVNTISRTSACIVGKIIDEGSDSIRKKGICWSLQPDPTLEDQSRTAHSREEGQFGKSCISGLAPGTTCYVRVYASNGAGTAYSEQESFTTRTADFQVQFNPALSYGTVHDIDGNSYRTIMIGTQEWMAENLKTTTYSDGTPIPFVTLDPLESDPIAPGYCWFQNNEETFKDMYGAYYNWFAVNTAKVCPSGWHVPSDEEWKIMEMFLGMTSEQADATGNRGTNEGEKIKETGTFNWVEENLRGSNESGFTALPGGLAHEDGDPVFVGEGIWGFWWSSTEDYYTKFAWYRGVHWKSQRISRNSPYKTNYFNIRCVKD